MNYFFKVRRSFLSYIVVLISELHKEVDDQENVVEFDFLGKDSIRYQNNVPVEKRVGAFNDVTKFTCLLDRALKCDVTKNIFLELLFV